MAIGKVGRNGTLNENGAFYSVQDVNVLLENSGGDVDLPKPTVEDAGKAVVVGEDGKYTLGEGGGSAGGLVVTLSNSGIDASYKQIDDAVKAGKNIIIIGSEEGGSLLYQIKAYASLTEDEQTNYMLSIYTFNPSGTYMGNILTSTNENDNMQLQL